MQSISAFAQFPPKNPFSLLINSKKILPVFITFLFLILSGDLLAQPTIYYAGVSYMGDAKSAKSSYPVITSINQSPGEKQSAPLDKAFLTILKETPDLPYKLIASDYGDYESGPAIAMTLAIERETVSVDRFPEYFKLVAEVSAQILFFDFQTMRLIASVPVDIARNDVVDIDDDLMLAKQANLKALYNPGNTEVNLFTIARDRIIQSSLPEENSLRFQVSSLSFGAQASPLIPSHLEMESLNQIFGQYFTAQLAQYAKLNMVPYTHGYAIRNKMSGRMSNGDVYELTLPEPDYVFDLSVTNFKTIKKTNKNIYAARVLLKAHEATDSELLIDEYLHYAVPMLVSKQQNSDTFWPGYEDALEMLLMDIAGQLNTPEKDWFETHSQRKSKTYKIFKAWSEQFNEI